MLLNELADLDVDVVRRLTRGARIGQGPPLLPAAADPSASWRRSASKSRKTYTPAP